MMFTLKYAWTWLNAKLNRDEEGQGATEYVLLILGTVLFLIAATFLLRDTLNAAVGAIGTWVSSVGPPP